jgi:hypothetical protein
MMKWFLAFGGIALIVFGVLVFHSRNFHASILNEASEDFGRLSGISAPSDFSATYGNVTYAGSETGGVGAAVMLVTSTPSLGGGTLVMAIVIVHNDRHEALTIGPTNFKILDTGGNLYSAAAGNSFPGDETSISSVEGLNPGLTTLYSIYFQVPSNLSMDDLTLKYYFDTGAKFVAVPLKVNSSGGAPLSGASSESGNAAATPTDSSQSSQSGSDIPQMPPTGTQQGPEPAQQSQPDATNPQPAPAGTQQPAPIVQEPPSNTPSPQSPH